MKYSRLSRYRIKKIMICFSEDHTVTSAAKILGINRHTINVYYRSFREKIFEHSHQEQKKELGAFELEKSYFGAKRVRVKRGRGAAGKTPVFGLLKCNGKVFVTVVPNCSKEELMPIIQGKILEGSVIHTDGWKAYDGLVLNGYDHYRVFYSANEFAQGKSHINGIECFWSFTKRRMSKFNGLTDDAFLLHLKKCGCRFNFKCNDFTAFIQSIFFSS